jgi:tripartite ATP-independent transporter DctP family solute receptor
MTTRRTLLKSALVMAPALSFGLTAKPARAETMSLKWANSLSAAHPLNTNLRKAFEKIKQDTQGKVEINLFSDGQLGGDSDMLAQVRSGALEFYTTAGVIIANLVPAAGIINTPFAFKDYATVWAAMDGDLGKHVAQAVGKVNLHVFDRFWDNGYRQITSGTRPVHNPGDLKGFKIRVPSSPINAALFKSLGAAPTILNVNDAYTAMQTRVVDGQENPLVTIATFNFHEVQKYCALTNHLWDAFIPVANGKFWNTLPEDVQTIISRNVNEFAVAQREDVRIANDNLRPQLEAKGLVFNTTESAEFRAVLKQANFYDEWQTKYGKEAWALLEKYSGPLS